MTGDQAELALDLGDIIGRLPSHGYVVISNLPRGSRLSQGYDSGDNTWTLMVDELPGLKFLPGPARGIVSLKAQIFDPAAGGVVQTKRELPLILHTDDAIHRRAPETKVDARNTTAPSIRKGAKKHGGTAHMSGEARENPNASDLSLPPPERRIADLVSAPSSDSISAPTAQGDNLLRPATVGQEDPVVTSVRTGEARGTEQSAVSEPLIKGQKFWGAEAERLFADAVAKLRHGADEVVKAAEQRHRGEVAELSGAIAKQHELITTLKKEAEQAANRHREAERSWQKAEAARMKAAQDAWAREKEELKREATLKEQEFAARFKKNIAEAEQFVLKARAECESAVVRCLGEAESAIRAIFQTKIKWNSDPSLSLDAED